MDVRIRAFFPFFEFAPHTLPGPILTRKPLEYHRKQKIERAKGLLARDGLLISGVARSVGFENSSYFSRIFKNETGYSPSEFRNRKTRTQSVDGEFYPYIEIL